MLQERTIKRIIFATDFFENSRLGLDYAVALAHHFHATIIMLHAVELPQGASEAETFTHRPSLSRTEASARLNSLAAGVRRAGVEVEAVVQDGIPSEVILAAVNTHRADLLVLGVYGVHRGLDHLVIGSNTEKILLSAECPTVTVGPHVMAGVDLTLHLKEILYFYDFTPEANAAAPVALMLGRSFGVPVDVCQLLPGSAENDSKLREELAEQYSASLRELSHSGESGPFLPPFQLDRSTAIEQIIERAKSQTAGLVVLGVKGQTHLGRHLHTSFAYQLLAKATCPVVTVRVDVF